MDGLKHTLIDFPEDPSKLDWQKEALLFYYYMMNKEDKYEKEVQKILSEFKKVFERTDSALLNQRKALYSELKLKLYNLKNKDPNFGRSLLYILLMSKVVNVLEDSLEEVISEKKKTQTLKPFIPPNIIEKSEKITEDMAINRLTKATNSLTRIIRTESWRYTNETRLDEFKQKGYKYKTTYPVKDNRTGDDSWYYYDQHQIVPIDEPFRYVWEGKERVFMTPPDRWNDRSILIPYIKK